ncbi:hypothetical protein SRHO_G00201370 [Serrasalmus rhombeus]
MLLKCHVLLSGGHVGILLLGYQQHRSESQGEACLTWTEVNCGLVLDSTGTVLPATSTLRFIIGAGQTLRLQDVRESPPSYPGPLGLVGRIGSLCQKSTGDSLALESRSFPYLLCTALQGSSRCLVGVLAGRTLTTLSTSVLSVAHWAGGMYQDHCVRKNCFS